MLKVFARPVCAMAPLITKRPASISTIGLENPARASFVLNTPDMVSATNAIRDTKSERSLPQRNRAEVINSIIRVMVMTNSA